MRAIKSAGSTWLLAFLLLLAACASPDSSTGTATAGDATLPPSAAETSVDAAVKPEAANPVADVGKPLLPGETSRQCKVDADCAIKDVGSCCGYSPQCVNKDSPTFPEQVKAQCASDGRMGVCGFPSISGCTCVEGQCAGVEGAMSDGAIQ